MTTINLDNMMRWPFLNHLFFIDHIDKFFNYEIQMPTIQFIAWQLFISKTMFCIVISIFWFICVLLLHLYSALINIFWLKINVDLVAVVVVVWKWKRHWFIITHVFFFAASRWKKIINKRKKWGSKLISAMYRSK